MGTRNLTAVFIDGEYKVAQYGQWDGYPAGQGRAALEFLHDVDLDRFKAAVRNCSWLDDGDVTKLWQDLTGRTDGWATMEESDRFRDRYPELHRDTGAKILDLVYQANGLKLQNHIEFAADGLFCEWAYVIDLDAGTFEVYSGFQTDDCEGRFKDMDTGGEYRPVSLLWSFDFDNLLSVSEFMQLAEEEEEEDAA